MKKLLVITPHLSTGGAPQVTANKIELLKDEFIIKVVEHSFAAWDYVVQRNKIIQLVGNHGFISLGENKTKELEQVIRMFDPDVISMEEFPEFFMEEDMANMVYNPNRRYTIIETTHDSSFNVKFKRYLPDRFVFVSAYSSFQYIDLPVPMEVIEYPVDHKTRDKRAMMEKFGLNPNFKHVVTVGLFTPRKNQAYAFELAKHLKNQPIKFHFIGNYAGNFADYWIPLFKDKPENCIIWGERNDVPEFLQACDMFLFPSKGEKYNKELNPIAIKEAMEYDIHKMMYNLDVYCNKYNGADNLTLLTGDAYTDAQNILKVLDVRGDKVDDEMIVVTTYPNTNKRKTLTKECVQSLKKLNRKIILVSHYPVSSELQKMVDYYIYDKNNVMIHHSYYNRFYRSTEEFVLQININNHSQSNQSLAALINLFNGIKLAKSLGCTKVMTLVYDVILDEKDVPLINDYFHKLDSGWHACLSYLDTALGKGVETTSMLFQIDYFLNLFADIRDGKEFTNLCETLGCHNFLEHYFMKILQDKVGLWIVNNEDNTILPNSGLGTSSNSEYFSLISVNNSTAEWVFYFYTYNQDDRTLQIAIKEEGVTMTKDVSISNDREYYTYINYKGNPIEINVKFYDGDNLYKEENYLLNEETINNHLQNGTFERL